MAQFPTEFVQMSTALITNKTFTEITEYGMNDEVAKRGNPQKWQLDVKTRQLPEEDARALNAFLDTLDGRFGTFTFPQPLKYLSADNNFQVDVGSSAGSEHVQVKGLPINNAKALVTGDFLTFAGHTKTYKIVETSASDASGKATVRIRPRLFADVSVNEVVGEGVFTLRLTKNDTSLSLSGSATHYPLKITAREA